jgi:membrane associated rhomboid family serine protease/GNAT superfamily N-acetyltransferase
LFLILLTLTIHMVSGPASDPQAFQTIQQLLFGVLQHGSWNHLAVNCGLTLFGGAVTERALGTVRMIVLVLVMALAGVLLEWSLGGAGFVGMSGIAYGLVAYSIIATSAPDLRRLNLLLIVLALSAEFALLRAELAVFTHIAGTTIGGGAAMLSSLFGKKGPHLKPMEWKHVSKAVEIIGQTDEDDAAEAERIFVDSGYTNMFVLVDRGEVLGVTGFGIDENVPDVAWLSWTYLDDASLGQGLGSQMLNDLLGMLAKHNIRKIFIETSDYEEDGRRVYASAHRLYQEFGANVELTLPDYHEVGEAKIIYGIDNPEAGQTDAAETDDTGIRVTGIEKAPETEDVAGFIWEETPVGIAGLDFYSRELEQSGFRMGVLPLPLDLSRSNTEELEELGFIRVGQLNDYYSTGQSQDWWIYHPK